MIRALSRLKPFVASTVRTLKSFVPALAVNRKFKSYSLFAASISKSALSRLWASTSARADTPHPDTSVRALPQTLRGNDARLLVGRADDSIPYEISTSPAFCEFSQDKTGSNASKPSYLPSRTEIYKYK